MDLFVEEVKDEAYLDPITGKFEPFEIIEETIKVRLGSDVIVKHRVTRNGIIMPLDSIDGSAGQAMPWISKEAIRDLGPGKAYSMAWILDPVIQKKMGVDAGKTTISKQRFLALDSPAIQTGENFIAALKDWSPFGLNIVFALLSGDIGYQATGVFPKRNHNVVQGVYAKLASKPENLWTGILTSDDLPYVVNPEKGYIVNTNNRIASHRMKHGVSHNLFFSHRAVRISELLE